MIDKEQLKKMLDHREMQNVLNSVEEVIDAAITRAATTLGDDFKARYPYIPEMETSFDFKGGKYTSLGLSMHRLGEVKAAQVRKHIVDEYTEAGYSIKWCQENIGYDACAFVIRIDDVTTALQRMEESDEK